MTVSDVVEVPNPGGTFSDASIASDRPDRGDLRRAEPGGQRRVAAGVDAGRAARTGTAGERRGAPGGQSGRFGVGPEGADLGALDGDGRLAHRSRRRAAIGW